MSRTPDPATEALLDLLEPEAKAAWEADILNIVQAIAASQAITDRRAVEIATDAAAVSFFSLPAEDREAFPPSLIDRFNPYEVEP
jgi:hypothetical protein